jgi:hypothetical protein
VFFIQAMTAANSGSRCAPAIADCQGLLGVASKSRGCPLWLLAELRLRKNRPFLILGFLFSARIISAMNGRSSVNFKLTPEQSIAD